MPGTRPAGKVRYVGVSSVSGWQVMKSLAAAERLGWPRCVTQQAHYSLVERDYEWELMPLARDQGLGALVRSPLGWGAHRPDPVRRAPSGRQPPP